MLAVWPPKSQETGLPSYGVWARRFLQVSRQPGEAKGMPVGHHPRLGGEETPAGFDGSHLHPVVNLAGASKTEMGGPRG